MSVDQKKLIIHPIPLFQTFGDKSRQTYRLNLGQPLALVNYVWYIEGTKEKILVDAGGSPDFFRKIGIPLEEIQTLDSGLKKVGVEFGDIDLIILTHLHHDHVAQASQFQKAKFLVQKDEFEFSQRPHPAVASSYVHDFFDGLDFVILDGDAKISDGISVIKTPGHSKGGQSVGIQTGQGLVIISGLCTIRENFEPPISLARTYSVIVPTIHIDVLEAYDNLIRLKQLADKVLPLHDSHENLRYFDQNAVRFELPDK